MLDVQNSVSVMLSPLSNANPHRLSPLPLPSLRSKRSLPAMQLPHFGQIQNIRGARFINNLFDYDAIPDVKWANMSIQDFSVAAMVAMLYIPQTIIAFAYNQHPYETLGRNGIMFTARLLLNAVTKSSKFSINSWFFDSAMQDKYLAAELKDAEGIGGWWNKTVHHFIQSRHGLDGDPFVEVMRPSGEFLKEADRAKAKWTGLKGNIEGSLFGYEKNVSFSTVLEQLEHNFDLYKRGIFTKEAILEKQDHFTINLWSDKLKKMCGPKEAASETINTRLGQLLTKEGHLVGEQDRAWVQQAIKRALRLYDEVDGIKPGQLDKQFRVIKDRLHDTVPKQRHAVLKEESSRFIEAIHGSWIEAAEPALENARSIAYQRFEKLIDDSAHITDKATLKAMVTEAKNSLAHVYENGTSVLKGSLPDALGTVFKPSVRRRVIAQFLERRNSFLLAQVGFMAVLNAVLVGQLAMILVFHTFARLDGDFDPEKYKQKLNHNKKPAELTQNSSGLHGVTTQPTVTTPVKQLPAAHKLTAVNAFELKPTQVSNGLTAQQELTHG